MVLYGTVFDEQNFKTKEKEFGHSREFEFDRLRCVVSRATERAQNPPFVRAPWEATLRILDSPGRRIRTSVQASAFRRHVCPGMSNAEDLRCFIMNTNTPTVSDLDDTLNGSVQHRANRWHMLWLSRVQPIAECHFCSYAPRRGYAGRTDHKQRTCCLYSPPTSSWGHEELKCLCHRWALHLVMGLVPILYNHCSRYGATIPSARTPVAIGVGCGTEIVVSPCHSVIVTNVLESHWRNTLTSIVYL